MALLEFDIIGHNYPFDFPSAIRKLLDRCIFFISDLQLIAYRTDLLSKACPIIYRLFCFSSSARCPNKHHCVQHKLNESSCHLAANQHKGPERYFEGLPRVLHWAGNLLYSLTQECNSRLRFIGIRVSWSIQVHQLHCVCRSKNKQRWSEQWESVRFHGWR